MKTYLPLLIITVLFAGPVLAQADLVANQNPNYAVSRAKYMKMADSLNTWHSTTHQEMYKAIDWLADRREARADRREFRRQLRLERARWNNDYFYDNNFYNPGYRGRWGNYNYFNGSRRSNFYLNPWGTGYWWR